MPFQPRRSVGEQDRYHTIVKEGLIGPYRKAAIAPIIRWVPLSKGWFLALYLGSLPVMRSGVIRHLIVALLSVTLVIGLVAHSIQAIDMGLQAAAMADGDMPMPGKCNGCAGDEKAMAAACFVYCSGVVAVPLAQSAFVSEAATVAWLFGGTIATGQADPPDPYPPKPTILS